MAIAIVFWMQYQWQYQYQLFVEYNTNCNTNTNCFWNAISMAIPIPIVCVIQYQWQYQYQFFFLCNFNINCNSNTFNCLRTNSNVQAINSYWNLPISIAIPIVPDLHKQLSMAMAIPSKTAIPMAPQYYCSCLAPTQPDFGKVYSVKSESMKKLDSQTSPWCEENEMFFVSQEVPFPATSDQTWAIVLRSHWYCCFWRYCHCHW